jgi:hypothetical protein
MRRGLPLVLLVAAFVSAGCTEPYEKQDGGVGDDPPCTPGVDGCPCPLDMRQVGDRCEYVDSILLDVQMTGTGFYAVGVPYPHGLWCLTGDDWLDGMQETQKLDSHSVRDVDRGKILWLEGRDTSRFTATVEVGNRTECQTLRYDPWSIDPDPAEDTIEVHSDQAVQFTIYVRTARGVCDDPQADAQQVVRVQMFEGDASGGWSTLPEKFDQPTC